jgi:TPR repeat protein
MQEIAVLRARGNHLTNTAPAVNYVPKQKSLELETLKWKYSMQENPINFTALYDSIENDFNRELCISLMRVLFEFGHAEALFALAEWSLLGKYDIELTTEEAVAALEKAANAGHEDAARNLGIMYEFGEHFPKNYPKAFELYLIAAFRGCTDSLEDVGRMITEKIVNITSETIAKIAFSEFDRVETEKSES